MFNGLDEIEDFVERLAPPTSAELKKQTPRKKPSVKRSKADVVKPNKVQSIAALDLSGLVKSNSIEAEIEGLTVTQTVPQPSIKRRTESLAQTNSHTHTQSGSAESITLVNDGMPNSELGDASVSMSSSVLQKEEGRDSESNSIPNEVEMPCTADIEERQAQVSRKSIVPIALTTLGCGLLLLGLATYLG